jgi:prepilin-type processing-associated H-X9-DG protein
LERMMGSPVHARRRWGAVGFFDGHVHPPVIVKKYKIFQGFVQLNLIRVDTYSLDDTLRILPFWLSLKMHVT